MPKFIRRLYDRQEAVDWWKDENVICLLEYALKKKGVDPRCWKIGALGHDDESYLVKLTDGSWVVGYGERGVQRELGRFPSVRDAVKFFYWNLVDAGSPWEFREAFEESRTQDKIS